MKLSIFFSGIHVKKWEALYNSISNVTSLIDYEFIIVSPYDLPPELEGKKNVKLIKDWGCPSRCSQLGLMHSQGEYVFWCADDGLFCPGLAIDKALNIIPKHEKGVVMLPYQEGPRRMRKGYWNIDFHDTLRQKYVPKGYILIMTALIRRDYLMEIGGFDCGFEQLGMASPDLAIRLQNDGAEVIVGENFMHLEKIKGKSDGHGPIVDAIFQNDIPYFTEVYSNPISATRTKINFNSWKQAEEVWSRRFAKDLNRKA